MFDFYPMPIQLHSNVVVHVIMFCVYPILNTHNPARSAGVFLMVRLGKIQREFQTKSGAKRRRIVEGPLGQMQRESYTESSAKRGKTL